MTDLPTNQKAGSTPGAKLPADATRQRETAPDGSDKRGAPA